MISLEEIASRLVDRKDYDFSANKGSWEPRRADDYVLSEFNITRAMLRGLMPSLEENLVRYWLLLIA